jgi:hypothetical protein
MYSIYYLVLNQVAHDKIRKNPLLLINARDECIEIPSFLSHILLHIILPENLDYDEMDEYLELPKTRVRDPAVRITHNMTTRLQ